MEKDLKTENDIDIVITAKDHGQVIFQIKDPRSLNKSLFNDLKKEFSVVHHGSIVVHADEKIIDLQRVFVEDTHKVI